MVKKEEGIDSFETQILISCTKLTKVIKIFFGVEGGEKKADWLFYNTKLDELYKSSRKLSNSVVQNKKMS